MNKLESDYAAILAGRCACGELAGYWFEAVSLNLAPGLRCSYTPDFLVQRADGVLECHEVKGFWEDDARVKIKCAAEKYPFIFVAVTCPNKKTGWRYERFGQEAPSGPASPGFQDAPVAHFVGFSGAAVTSTRPQKKAALPPSGRLQEDALPLTLAGLCVEGGRDG